MHRVNALTVTPDGMYAISGGGSGYGAWIGCRSRRNLTQHQWTVFGVAVSPDGKYLASSEGIASTFGT